jgi:CheY-like chemotaxis protein/anti-sigma regulatory factor (Ser/Thr protein kinase)
MAGGISHDFNNLLTVILGSCDMLRLDRELKPESRDLINNVRKAGERAASLTRQMLLFSRQRPVTLSPMDLNAAVEETARMVGRLIGEHITVNLDLMREPALILASEDLLNQILMNLGANARDAISDAGTVWISTAPTDDGKIRLTFKDTGSGMDAATKERIFEPFFTTKEVGKGTGLGLSTVFGIVKTLGATIQCESEPGKGTVFQIDFPCAKNALGPQHLLVSKEGSKEGAAPREQYRGLEVLLVEDNPGILELASKNLRRAGFEVFTAQDPRRALELWRERKATIRLLVTDVVMPGKNGRELAEELRKDKPGLQVLFMSGHTMDELLLRGVQEDRIALLQKPFTSSQLLDKVHQVLETPDLQK